MKVWVIGRNYPLPGNGMQGSFELEQAKMLARFGNDVQYLACSLHPTKRIRRRGMLSWGEDGLEVNVLSAFFVPRVFPLYLVKFRNSFWRKLFAAVESRHGLPEVIHVHYPAMLMIADALAEYRRRGVRIIATEHWIGLSCANTGNSRSFSTRCSASARRWRNRRRSSSGAR